MQQQPHRPQTVSPASVRAQHTPHLWWGGMSHPPGDPPGRYLTPAGPVTLPPGQPSWSPPVLLIGKRSHSQLLCVQLPADQAPLWAGPESGGCWSVLPKQSAHAFHCTGEMCTPWLLLVLQPSASLQPGHFMPSEAPGLCQNPSFLFSSLLKSAEQYLAPRWGPQNM